MLFPFTKGRYFHCGCHGDRKWGCRWGERMTWKTLGRYHHHGVSICLWTAETEVSLILSLIPSLIPRWEWKFIKTEYVSPLPKTTIEATVGCFHFLLILNDHLLFTDACLLRGDGVLHVVLLPTYTLTSCLHGNHSENNVLLWKEKHFQNATWTVLPQSPVNMHVYNMAQNSFQPFLAKIDWVGIALYKWSIHHYIPPYV